MKALVYHGPGRIAFEERAKPELASPTDAIVRMVKTTLCASDLRILKGDVASCGPNRVLGHEGIGIVEEVGRRVTTLKLGDKVLISSVSACGACQSCRELRYANCDTGGWILGNIIDGTQAEFVRIPHANLSLHPIAADVDEDALVLFSELVPTGFECGVVNGAISPGGVIAIIGCGTIGLATLLAAQLKSPAAIFMIDRDDYRLALAKKLGATAAINSGHDGALDAILAATGGHGVDTAIDAVAIPDTFALCAKIAAPGATIVIAGGHGTPLQLDVETASQKNIAVVTRPVDTTSTPELLRLSNSGAFDLESLISHRLKLADIIHAYDLVARSPTTRALKVILEA